MDRRVKRLGRIRGGGMMVAERIWLLIIDGEG